MTNKPNETTPKLNASQAALDSSEPTENSETAHEAVIRLTSGNPRFIHAKPTGKAFVIGGVKPK